MTAPLDEKGHDPKLVAALRSLVKRLENTPEQLRGPFLVKGLKPYLSTVALPDELEVVAWSPEDMEEGRTYESKYFGLVTYRGIDEFHGDKTFSFDIGRGQMRYTKRLNEFLAPRKASSEALAAMRARIDELEAAVDAEEKPHGMPWRFWSDKSRELANKLYDANTRAETAETEVLRLTEENEALRADSDQYKDAGHTYYARALKAEAKVRNLEALIDAQHGDVVARTAKLLYEKDDKIIAAEDRIKALEEALSEFGSSRVRDRVAKAVGCNHDLLHDALQNEVRAALTKTEGE